MKLYISKFRPVAEQNSRKQCNSPNDIFLLEFNGKPISNFGNKVEMNYNTYKIYCNQLICFIKSLS